MQFSVHLIFSIISDLLSKKINIKNLSLVPGQKRNFSKNNFIPLILINGDIAAEKEKMNFVLNKKAARQIASCCYGFKG